MACEEPETGSCIADLYFVLPTGDQSRIDFCAAFTLSAEYEFDPDDPPEIRNATLRLDATTDEGFECWVEISEAGACGEGEYLIDAEITQVTMDTSDCTDIPDEFEGTTSAVEGTLAFTILDAGGYAGNFTGEPLTTRVAGTLDVKDAAGLVFGGAFDVTMDVTAGDAEESACALAE